MLFSLVLEERLKTIKSIQVYTVILYEFQQLSNFELEFDYTCSTIKFLDAKESFQRFDRSECRLVLSCSCRWRSNLGLNSSTLTTSLI